MAWYKTGTISVTNGSATVTGTGTAFVANVRAGYGLVGPDGRTYEVAAVVSNTQLTLAGNYQGSTASGQSYAIFPTQGVIADLATQAASLITSFATVRDGVGAGLHPDGSAATPAIRFSADQDTGVFRATTNTIALATGGSERVRVNGSGNVGIGTNSPGSRLHIVGGNIRLPSSAANENALVASEETFSYLGITMPHYGVKWAAPSDTASSCLLLSGFGGIRFLSGSAERARFGSGGVFEPGTDNSQGLGSSSKRWSTVYAGTGTINTSDEREKTWRGGLSDAEYAAGLEVLAELGFYQWNDAIAAKGPEGARYHFGIAAQTVWEIFAAHGLVDPIEDGKPGETPYGFLCWDEWDEEAEPELGAGNRYGVRTDELALFLLAVQARRQAELEARLAALENAAA